MQTINDQTWQRIKTAVTQWENTKAGPSSKNPSNSGEVMFWAKIGAFNDPWYPWTKVLPDGAGAWTNTSISGSYAIESNAVADLEEDTIVRLYCVGYDIAANLIYSFQKAC